MGVLAIVLMHRFHDLLGTRLQILKSKSAGAAHQTVDDERPMRRVDARHPEVGKDE
jgi:hypothetical protein